MRGYDPAEVDRRLDELTAAVTSLTQQRDGLAARVQELHDAATATPRSRRATSTSGPASGRSCRWPTPRRPSSATRPGGGRGPHDGVAPGAPRRCATEADQYAARVRSEADATAARIVEDARKAADEHRDSAERDASVRLQEAEAVYEEQRARAAKAAADFETTLAGRRTPAEDEFTQKMARVPGPSRRGERAGRAHPHRRRVTPAPRPRKEAGRLIEDARQDAARIVSDAKATAERIRTDSERELTAATQRRDSINAQLANVRQMLATLTGTAPFRSPGLRPGRVRTTIAERTPSQDAEVTDEASTRRRRRGRGGRAGDTDERRPKLRPRTPRRSRSRTTERRAPPARASSRSRSPARSSATTRPRRQGRLSGRRPRPSSLRAGERPGPSAHG